MLCPAIPGDISEPQGLLVLEACRVGQPGPSEPTVLRGQNICRYVMLEDRHEDRKENRTKGRTEGRHDGRNEDMLGQE